MSLLWAGRWGLSVLETGGRVLPVLITVELGCSVLGAGGLGLSDIKGWRAEPLFPLGHRLLPFWLEGWMTGFLCHQGLEGGAPFSLG